MSIPDDFTEEVALERMQKSLRRHISGTLLENAVDVDVILDRVAESVVYHFTYRVLGEMLDHVEAHYPATWWEHVKARFAPQWFLDRWPVEYASVTLQARALYPKISLPDAVIDFEKRSW